MAKVASKVWERMGEPKNFSVIEMGAGMGTLAKDFLYWSKELFPKFYRSLAYTILEYGEGMIFQQKDKINKPPKKLSWVHGSALQFPFKNVKGIIISNELADAFPVEIVTKKEGAIAQKYVTEKNGQLSEEWGEPSEEIIDYLKKYGIEIKEGVEEPINLNAAVFQDQVCQALDEGAILTIDYGSKGKSIGIRKRASRVYSNELAKINNEREYRELCFRFPGSCDITANVNFLPLIKTSTKRDFVVDFAGPQGKFLETKVGMFSLIKEIPWQRLKSLALTQYTKNITEGNLSTFKNMFVLLLLKNVLPIEETSDED